MEEIKLDVQIRNEIGTRHVKRVRRQEFVPGVIYGRSQKSTPIKVDRKIFERIRRQQQTGNIIFHLNVKEGDKLLKDYSAIVKEEQHDPVTDRILHIDFNSISLTEKIEVKVAVVAKGEPIGVKVDGGSLEHVLWELDVICLPTQIPQSIEVDVSQLKIADSIHVKDIQLPEGVTTKHDPEAIILAVAAPMKEEVVAPTAEPVELEVIKEKKELPAEKKPIETEERKEEKKEEKKEKKEK